MPTELEEALYWQIVEAMLPEPERDALYLKGRKFRADFLWRKQKVVAEVQGGTYQHMGHSTGAGISRDYAKSNCAQLRGWQTRIDKAQRELREYIDDLEGWLPAPDPHEELWGQQ